ncbi:SIR2 family protein [Arthrobacter sp. MYb213]|uniref:SIR2 family protein n=1 Tax=Arthrobacter sp. MYb213 TaxID=1848595 RepID=UPI000CFB4837|nr:SIR2 family protein [Arthrobacter sp. MYb213]PRB71412.1 hypothetical protein CQ011_05790 [Arthrobacter sp. MYb213]
MTGSPARTVAAVLEKFTSTFSAFSTAFSEGQYVLWLGSGISRDRVKNVAELLSSVVEHLRANIEPSNNDCEYRTALIEVLNIASLGGEEKDSLDFTTEFKIWPLHDRIVASLITNYAKVLDVPVGDLKPDDYLVWTALDVPNTYGAPNLVPDVEHYCIAILMLEGVVSSAVTANWDGLLEKALAELTPAFESRVRVAVTPEDFRNTGPLIEVIKFHGCAVRARDSQNEYRRLLVARESQISRWTEQPENRSMRKHLEVLYSDRLTLMLGLSAQDANLHTVFASAIQDLERPWPVSPPPVVLSEERLEAYHRSLLKITYGSNHPGNASAIAESALLGAYSKPTLLALVLASLTEKLCVWIQFDVQNPWNSTAVRQLQDDLRNLRDFIATLADPALPEAAEYVERLAHQRLFAARIVDVVNFALTVFRTGRIPAPENGRYEPLSVRPAAQALLEPDFPAQQFGRLGVALSLIGRGLVSGLWSVSPGGSRLPQNGVMRLVTSDRDTRVFFVKDSGALTQLEMNGSFDVDDSEMLIIMADEEPPSQTRSPRGRFGRGSKPGPSRFSVASGVAETKSADDLYEAFKLAGGF